MNCKQGDLAIIVRSWAGNEGKIVCCVKYVGEHPILFGSDIWLLDKSINAIHADGTPGVPLPYTSDANLRPLRGLDEPLSTQMSDEVTAWSSK